MAVFLIIIGIIIGLCIYFFMFRLTKLFCIKRYDIDDYGLPGFLGGIFPLTWLVILFYEVAHMSNKLFEEKKIPIIIIEKGAQVSSAKQAEQMRELLNTWDEIKGRILWKQLEKNIYPD